MKSTVVDESLSSFKPMYCSREYQASTRLIQQYEKSTLKNPNISFGSNITVSEELLVTSKVARFHTNLNFKIIIFSAFLTTLNPEI